MKFGHHGANHPVEDLAGNVVMITSQNHGFAVDEENLRQLCRPRIAHYLTAAAGYSSHRQAGIQLPGSP